MSFDSFAAFIEMGGHGPYVWGSYLVAILVVAYNVIAPIRERRRTLAATRDAIARESS